MLLLKPRTYQEIYNDLDEEIVNLFNVCRVRGPELIAGLELTPFSRVDFEMSYEPCEDPLERARRTVIRSYMGFGSAAASGKVTGFRVSSTRSGTTPARDWMNYTNALPAIIERLRGVVIENRDALDVIKANDGLTTLHYVDPPYVLHTRHRGDKTKEYRYEMTDGDHINLCAELLQLKGMVVLSGYDNDIYNNALPGYRKISKTTNIDKGLERCEVLWLSPNCPTRALFN